MTPALRQHWPPVLLATVCLLLQTGGDAEWLRYQRADLPAQGWWRFLTANFIHLGWSHWLLNMLGLALVYILVGMHFNRTQWLLITLISCLGVSGGLFVLNPKLHWYVGFSGALHGLLLAGALADVYRQNGRGRLFGVLLIACVIGKLAWEQKVGSLPGSAAMAGGPVVVDSHLYGAIAGALAGILVLAYLQFARQQREQN